ncbi:hypothetical protein [Campylobacter ureolyticus]|uniref:hypothetical protein n=1 Tax=Campylobacter ureolyticus TaxID=827 RepID=UPI0022B4512F|nr:hypothetical protein [Campylobacter ureolyticus]MCZ6110884.1 hypothetical protein [Campylobacter ureolyticus]MDK8323779.1 hypothetical protein [Campylobacter ureolyticus]
MLLYYPHSSEYAILAMIILLAMFKPNFILGIITSAVISVIVLFTTKNAFFAVCALIIVFFIIRAFKK